MDQLRSATRHLLSARRSPAKFTEVIETALNEPDGGLGRLTGVPDAGARLPKAISSELRDQFLHSAGVSEGATSPRVVSEAAVAPITAWAGAALILLLRNVAGTTEALKPDHPCYEKEQIMDSLRERCLALWDDYIACRKGEAPAPPEAPDGGTGSLGDPAETETTESMPETAGEGSKEDCSDLWEALGDMGGQWLSASTDFGECMSTN